MKRTKAQEACKTICEIIEAVDNRCAAADGPVLETLDEMTPKEIRQIYVAAKTARGAMGED